MMSLSGELNRLRKIIQESAVTQPGVWKGRKKGAWDQLWCAVDNLEDTQSAIDEFKDKPADKLGSYGVLQAMAVQQDAVKHIEEALGLQATSLEGVSEIQEIRAVRDEVAGHPTNTRRNGEKSSYKGGTISYTSVSPNSIGNKTLEYVVWSKDGSEFRKIDLEDAIRKQDDALAGIVESIIQRVEAMEEDHRKKFEKESTQEILNQTGYFIQKLWPHERNREYSQICLDSLKNTYNSFKNALKARYGHNVFNDDPFKPGLTLTVGKIDKLLPRVEDMILLQERVDELDLEVYVESLDHAFSELRDMAKETDEEFGFKKVVTDQKPIISEVKSRKKKD